MRKYFLDKWLMATILIWGGYFTAFWIFGFFQQGDTLYVNGISTWLDVPTFVNMITSFQVRPFMEWLNTAPEQAFQGIRYFFLAPLIPAFLSKYLGVSALGSLRLFAGVVNFILIASLIYFFKNHLRSSKKMFLALMICFMGGGLLWLKWPAFMLGSPESFFTNHLFQYHPTQVPSTLIYLLLPSRSLCLGTAYACLLLAYILRKDIRERSWKELTILSFFSFPLVFIYPQSLLLVFSVCLFSLIQDIQQKKALSKWMWYGALTTFFSFISLYLFYRSDELIYPFSFSPFWFLYDKTPWEGVKFIFFEFGVFYPLAIWVALKKKYCSPIFRNSIFFLMAIFTLFILQPNPYDGSRILFQAKILLCIPLVQFFVDLWHRGKKVILWILLFLICFEPVINMVELLIPHRLSYPFYSERDVQIAEEFKNISAPQDIVLNDGRRNHWVNLFSGRKLLIGDRQYLWTLGVPWKELDEVAKEIYLGTDKSKELIDQYHIKFIVVDKRPYLPSNIEKRLNWILHYSGKMKVNKEFFDKQYKPVVQNDDCIVYEVR